jgi:hypothetical protein
MKGFGLKVGFMIARVQQFKVLKGYGWLLEGFRNRIWFHVSAWKSDIPPRIGMMVSFDTAPARDGKPDQAINVTPLDGQEKFGLSKEDQLVLAATEILDAATRKESGVGGAK